MVKRSYKIGHNREQVSLLPPCIEDYVGRDNPVRAIDAYVDSLDLNKLDFCDVGSEGGAGQPPYDPADLLKLYLYGYLNQVRSSRRLEREARRNTEVIWLLQGLTPGYRTIANFRKNNAAGLRAANREFVVLARSLDLLGGELAALDRSIAEYYAAGTANDQAEEAAVAASTPPSGDITAKLTALRQRRATAAPIW